MKTKKKEKAKAPPTANIGKRTRAQEKFTKPVFSIKKNQQIIDLTISEIRYRRLFETAKDGILILDAETSKITDANPFICKLLNFSLEELIGKELWELGFFKDKKANKAAMKELQENYFIRYDDLPLETKLGKLIDVEFVSNVYIENGQKVIQCNIHDITERKKIENAKDDFIGIASHELRTPVTSIKAYSQILQNRFSKTEDTKSIDLVDKMDKQIDKLDLLISDLLDITKIESGSLQFNETCFDFNELINEIIEENKNTTIKHEIITKLAPTATVCGDRDRIGQVITNFITNAIKYSPRHISTSATVLGKIIIKTIADKENVILCVQDFGVGLSKKEQEKIFERFYRVSGINQNTYPGLGLGLYIVSEISKRHKGKVWVESKINKGSTFFFSLPLNQQSLKSKKIKES